MTKSNKEIKVAKVASVKFPEDIWKDIQRLKKSVYYDRPYTDIYQDLLRLGVEAYRRGERLER